MRKPLVLLLGAVFFQLLLSGTASAASPEFKLGFATLASLIPDVAGVPIENEHYGPNGDALQPTSTGLMVWRKADNWTAFTNGYRSWINGPSGLQARLNSQRFDWEAVPAASTQTTAAGVSAPAPTAVPTRPAPTTDWRPRPGAVSAFPIVGFIDSPKNGDTVVGEVTVTGWAAASPAPTGATPLVDSFIVTVDSPDGSPLAGTMERVDRPDVAGAIGNSVYRDSGFRIRLTAGTVSSGQHILYLRVHGPSSGWWYKSVSVNVSTLSSAATAWLPLLQDQKLRDALTMAYAYAPDWRSLADQAAQRQVQVKWATLADNVGGMTDIAAGIGKILITINSTLTQEATQVAAAVLGHETYHAATGSTVNTTEACYQNEIAAFKWQAYVWQHTPRPTPDSNATRTQDAVVLAVDSGQIDGLVRQSPSYQRECARVAR